MWASATARPLSLRTGLQTTPGTLLSDGVTRAPRASLPISPSHFTQASVLVPPASELAEAVVPGPRRPHLMALLSFS